MKIEDIKRDTEAIECDCHGYAERVEATIQEKRMWGCLEDKEYKDYECCVRVFQCKLCGKRICGTAPSPEVDML